MSAIVYLLCALTSAMCAVLLFLGYRRDRSRMAFWTSTCFSFLAINNILLFTDLVVTPPEIDLAVIRTIPAVLGFACLAWGFLWDTP